VRGADADHFAARTRGPDTTWWAGRSLTQARNAHRTNTKEQFAEALTSGANWFEGDIRKELHSDTLEMRHDTSAESGDNMTLKEWLAAGKASGRGLKLDVKDGDQMARILDEVEAAGIPSERLMFNIGASEATEFGAEIRRRFPRATVALNPSGDLSETSAAQMMEQARDIGGPVTFVTRADQLTPELAKTLEAVGPVSVWNDPGRGGLDERGVKRLEQRLRAQGVTGMIDLRPSESTIDKIKHGVDKAKNIAGEWVHDRVSDVGSAVSDFVGGL
jgi:hypothetical protein